MKFKLNHAIFIVNISCIWLYMYKQFSNLFNKQMVLTSSYTSYAIIWYQVSEQGRISDHLYNTKWAYIEFNSQLMDVIWEYLRKFNSIVQNKFPSKLKTEKILFNH